MKIKDIPVAIAMYAVVGTAFAASPVFIAANAVQKLSDKAVDRFENGPKK